ncbi:MAG: sulfur carrier protein ThiS [Kiritimatiellia bacterium]
MSAEPEDFHVLLNGSRHEHHGDRTIRSLLGEMSAIPERVAIVLNENVIRRTDWDAVRISAGDRVEVLTFAGGG